MIGEKLISTGGADVGFTTWTHQARYPGAGANNTDAHTLISTGGNIYWVTSATTGVGYSIQFGPYFNNRGISSGNYPHTPVGSGKNTTNYDLITKGYVGGTYSWVKREFYGGSVSGNLGWAGPAPLSNTDINFAIPDGTNAYYYEIRSNNSVRRYNALNFNTYVDITLPISVPRQQTSNGSLVWDGVGFWYCFNSTSTQWSAIKFPADLSTVTVPQINLITISGSNVGTTLGTASYDISNNRMFLKGTQYDSAELFTLS